MAVSNSLYVKSFKLIIENLVHQFFMSSLRGFFTRRYLVRRPFPRFSNSADGTFTTSPFSSSTAAVFPSQPVNYNRHKNHAPLTVCIGIFAYNPGFYDNRLLCAVLRLRRIILILFLFTVYKSGCGKQSASFQNFIFIQLHLCSV